MILGGFNVKADQAQGFFAQQISVPFAWSSRRPLPESWVEDINFHSFLSSAMLRCASNVKYVITLPCRVWHAIPRAAKSYLQPLIVGSLRVEQTEKATQSQLTTASKTASASSDVDSSLISYNQSTSNSVVNRPGLSTPIKLF